MKITIRKAKLSEIPIIDEVGEGQVEFHRQLHTPDEKYYDIRKKNYRTIWRKWAKKHAQSKNSLLLVACDNNKIIGYCLSFIKKNIPIFKITEYGYVSDLYVEEAYRRKGIGKKLLTETKKFFKKKKIPFMELAMNHNNHKAYKFYTKFGFKDYNQYLRMRI